MFDAHNAFCYNPFALSFERMLYGPVSALEEVAGAARGSFAL
jgi:hypothetical protein